MNLVTLLNSLTSSSGFSIDSLGFSTQAINLFANKESFYLFFLNLDVFYFFHALLHWLGLLTECRITVNASILVCSQSQRKSIQWRIIKYNINDRLFIDAFHQTKEILFSFQFAEGVSNFATQFFSYT